MTISREMRGTMATALVLAMLCPAVSGRAGVVVSRSRFFRHPFVMTLRGGQGDEEFPEDSAEGGEENPSEDDAGSRFEGATPEETIKGLRGRLKRAESMLEEADMHMDDDAKAVESLMRQLTDLTDVYKGRTGELEELLEAREKGQADSGRVDWHFECLKARRKLEEIQDEKVMPSKYELEDRWMRSQMSKSANKLRSTEAKLEQVTQQLNQAGHRAEKERKEAQMAIGMYEQRVLDLQGLLTDSNIQLTRTREAFKVHLAACGAGIDDESLLDSKVPPGSMGQALDEEIAQLDLAAQRRQREHKGFSYSKWDKLVEEEEEEEEDDEDEARQGKAVAEAEPGFIAHLNKELDAARALKKPEDPSP